ncbi:hypothetical protein MIMGU_mgv11b018103mg [Erythranthe guttata]|uniref:Uncharacterized protein n=1 Tax=Erythranthe guttata TaxID=4155 RepID=A0A022QCR4_ERYGU|nr:hypothetical protein MIMGU_mgv11b018103mg [Erythranthe guttata]
MVEGLSFSQFSFQVPKPLQENYVRKRPRPPPQNDAVNTEVKPIAWISDNDVDTDLQLSGPRLPAEYSEDPYPATQATKKKKMTSSSSVGCISTFRKCFGNRNTVVHAETFWGRFS